jgi:surface antigen
LTFIRRHLSFKRHKTSTTNALVFAGGSSGGLPKRESGQGGIENLLRRGVKVHINKAGDDKRVNATTTVLLNSPKSFCNVSWKGDATDQRLGAVEQLTLCALNHWVSIHFLDRIQYNRW